LYEPHFTQASHELTFNIKKGVNYMSSPSVIENLDASNEENVNLTQNPTSSEANPTRGNDKPPPNPHSKPCTLCQRPRDVLVRCQIDKAKKWHFLCTGKCWQQVSGGSADGDREHPLYRYGGMWKNKHEAVSAKIKGKAKKENKGLWHGTPGPHRRRGVKAWSKRVGKGSGMLGDAKVKDDDGGSDIEVSDLSDDEDDGEMLSGLEKEGEDNKVAKVS
jgi:hypothetical protein